MPNLNIKLRLNEAVQKADEAPGDCQDAYDFNAESNRYAIADGVSQSFFPAEWARLLVNYFCNDMSPLNADLFTTQNWREWLTPVQQKWAEEVKGRVQQKKGPNAIHLRNSLVRREPAAATFVGVQIESSPGGGEAQWHAMVIGDSCLFHIRDGQFSSYPLTNPSEFGYHPEHFASNGDQPKYEPRFVSGKVKDGDVLILTTDALAKWILTRNMGGAEARRETLARLLELRRWGDLYRFIGEARQQIETPLEDDDVALVILSAAEKDGAGAVEMSGPASRTERSRPPRVAAVGRAVAGAGEQMTSNPPPQTGEGEETRPVWPGRRRESWLSILALCLSAASIVISLVGAYRPQVGVTPQPPMVASGTPAAPTPAAGDTPSLASPAAAVIDLPSGSFVSLEPGPQGAKVLTIDNSTQAKTLPDPAAREAGWTKVEMDLWVSAARPFTSLKDSKVNIDAAVNARNTADLNGVLIGKFARGAVFKKVGEVTDSRSNKWYQVRVEGFTPSK